MLNKAGVTLFETIVVLIILGITVAFFFPNFTAPTEQARALNAQNNLLAIYSAEHNYNNDKGGYCTTSLTPNPEPTCAEAGSPTCAPDLASINCNLSLNIQDDRMYLYSCTNATGFTCTASRNNGPGALTLTVIQ